MKKSRFSEEKMIAVLKQAEVGVKAAELCLKHGISVSVRSGHLPALLDTGRGSSIDRAPPASPSPFRFGNWQSYPF